MKEGISLNEIIIEKDLLEKNIQIIKTHLANLNKDKTPNIIAVVKDDAYGLGCNNLIPLLLKNGINSFATTSVDEALKIKDIALSSNILILNATEIEDDIIKIVENDFIASVGSFSSLKLLNDISSKYNKITKYHINIDTGFSRFGFLANDIINNKNYLKELVSLIKSPSNTTLCGIYSHFQQSYETSPKRTKEQFNLFNLCINALKSEDIDVGIRHIANSNAFLKYPYMHLDAIRVGGVFTGRVPNNIGLSKIGYLQSDICAIKKLPKGSKIGYSGTHKLKNDATIAIIEAGYCDGIGVHGPQDNIRIIDKLRNIKLLFISLFKDTKMYVYINNKKAPILGRVGMKNCMIDITNIDCKVGDKVKIDVVLSLSNQNIKTLFSF